MAQLQQQRAHCSLHLQLLAATRHPGRLRKRQSQLHKWMLHLFCCIQRQHVSSNCIEILCEKRRYYHRHVVPVTATDAALLNSISQSSQCFLLCCAADECPHCVLDAGESTGEPGYSTASNLFAPLDDAAFSTVDWLADPVHKKLDLERDPQSVVRVRDVTVAHASLLCLLESSTCDDEVRTGDPFLKTSPASLCCGLQGLNRVTLWCAYAGDYWRVYSNSRMLPW